MNALELGDEAILVPADFTMSGPDMRGVRQAVTRARRAGLTVRIRRHRDISDAEMEQTIDRADGWRDTESERGFSMALGRLGDPADTDCLLVEALDPDDLVVAMLSLVPWGTSGVSLDLMRRSPQSPNGTIELMVSELALRAEGLGISRISLNFAMFRSAEQGAHWAPGRWPACGVGCWSSFPGGGRSRRCTDPTRSISRNGCPATPAMRTRG